jgi:hypothetical protein
MKMLYTDRSIQTNANYLRYNEHRSMLNVYVQCIAPSNAAVRLLTQQTAQLHDQLLFATKQQANCTHW